MRRIIITLCSWLLSLIAGMPLLIGGGLIGFDADGRSARGSDSLFISTQIHEQVAVTTTTQVFTNSSMRASPAIYGFALPANAMVTKLRWKTRDTWYIAEMQASGTGQSSGGSSSTMDVFARHFGATPFTFTVKDSIKAMETITVELTYVELLPFADGLVHYTYPLTHAPQTTSPHSIDSWQIDIRSARPVSDVETMPLMVPAVERTDQRVLLRTSSVTTADKSVSVRFKPQYDNLTMNVLSTKPVNEDGYALMLAVPRSDTDDDDVLPKRFTFVIDRSGSMNGRRLEHARVAAKYCVEHLSPQDVFNIVRFDDAVETMYHTHVPATPANITDAVNYINGIQSRGGTNIMAALSTALSMHEEDRYVNIIIFLTDGEAEVNHTALKAANKSNTRVYVFGVGNSINIGDLSRIGQDHNGRTVFVYEASSTADAVSTLFNFIKDPIIKNPKVSFSPDVVYDVYPKIVPDVYLGQQLVLVGRYRQPGLNTVTVSGSDSRGDVHSTYLADLSGDPNVNMFVAKVWANYRIAMLLEWMQNVSPGSPTWMEWHDEIIRLGQTYGILTPFTALVDGGRQDDGGGPTSVTHDEIHVAQERCTVTPNPIIQAAAITIDLQDLDRTNVRVEIIDLRGNVIAVLYDAADAAEQLNLTWDSKDQYGVPVSAGAYQLVITIDGRRSTTMVHVLR